MSMLTMELLIETCCVARFECEFNLLTHTHTWCLLRPTFAILGWVQYSRSFDLPWWITGASELVHGGAGIPFGVEHIPEARKYEHSDGTWTLFEDVFCKKNRDIPASYVSSPKGNMTESDLKASFYFRLYPTSHRGHFSAFSPASWRIMKTRHVTLGSCWYPNKSGILSALQNDKKDGAKQLAVYKLPMLCLALGRSTSKKTGVLCSCASTLKVYVANPCRIRVPKDSKKHFGQAEGGFCGFWREAKIHICYSQKKQVVKKHSRKHKVTRNIFRCL